MEEEHVVKILKVESVTHDVKRFWVEKPEGYQFKPGQATEISLNKEGWRDKKRPFTFTSLNGEEHLEFTIKIYQRGGVTEELGKLNEGDELIIHDVWGAIHYKGPGVFIAGGAGVTPFIAIFRELKEGGKLRGNTLLFSNKEEKDIILHGEFNMMEDLKKIYTLTRSDKEGYEHGRVNTEFLKKVIDNFDQNFYICGPAPMVGELQAALQKLGASAEGIVFET